VTGIKIDRATPEGRRLGRWLRVVALCTMAAASLWSPAGRAADATQQLVYNVKHSVFGDIGTYTNLIQSAGDTTTVHTTAHFAVKALGIGLHNEDADRLERWTDHGTRLLSFQGVTKKNGDVLQIKGEANGNNFVIQSSAGTVTAPATIRPANPWSAKCLQSTTMMRVDTGKVEQVRVTGGKDTTVNINGANVPAREYEIDGSQHYKLWFDRQDLPVMFVVDDDSGQVTFTLRK
jgi:hypothetical protein